ncbi:MAG: hypothetical protein ACTSQ8_13675 [Candidatus Helarchaeota archaeon]
MSKKLEYFLKLAKVSESSQTEIIKHESTKPIEITDSFFELTGNSATIFRDFFQVASNFNDKIKVICNPDGIKCELRGNIGLIFHIQPQ